MQNQQPQKDVLNQDLDIQIQPLLSPPVASRNISSHLPDYLKLMDIRDVQMHKANRQLVMKKLKEQQIHFLQAQDNILKISIVQFTKNYEYVLLNVHYSQFAFHVSVLNINQQSNIHKIQKCHRGNFSTVYHTIYQGKNMAVKCTHFKHKTFLKVFRDTLLQYLSFKVITKLKSGPKMSKIFGFDLLVFKNCIEFSMQFCSQKLRAKSARNDLKECLRNIHALKIIHFDIKPQNICFSQEYKKHVFIDLGLHRIISEQIGQNSFTNFQGSLLFCSKQMRECYLNGQAAVDLYYNDAISLQGTLKQIEDNNFSINNFQHHRPKKFHQTQQFILINIKYYLIFWDYQAKERINGQKQRQYFLKQAKTKKQIQSQYIKRFISILDYSINIQIILKQLYIQNTQLFIGSIVHNKFQKQFKFIEQQSQAQDAMFKARMKALKLLNQSRSNQRKQLPLDSHYIEYINFLTNQENARTWQTRIYLQVFSFLLQINSWKVDINNKRKLCQAFNEVFLNMQNFKSFEIEEKTKICFTYISNFIKAGSSLDDNLYKIIKNILTSIILLQIYSQLQLLQFFSKIINLQCTLIKFIRICFLVLSCIQWNNHVRTIYCPYYLKNEVYQIIIHKLPIKKYQTQQEHNLVEFLSILVKNGYKKKKEKYFFLWNTMNRLIFCLNYKILKYYNAINEYQQCLAQIYVYFSYSLFQNTRQISVITDLIKLHTYQQEQGHCIINYFQFPIAYSLSRFKQKDKYKILEQFASPSINFKCFQKLRLQISHESYFQQSNSLYFFEKPNNVSSVYILVNAYNYYYSFVLKQQRSQFIKEKISFLSNLTLQPIYSCFNYLISISKYQLYEDFQIVNSFAKMCQIITQYILIKQKLNIQIDLQSIKRQIYHMVDSLQCRNKTQFLIIIITQFYQRGIEIINEQQIFTLILWMMRSHQIEQCYLLRLMKKVICINSKRYYYYKLYVEYILNNNIQIGFLTLQKDYNVDLQVMILFILWEERQIKINSLINISYYKRSCLVIICQVCDHYYYSKKIFFFLLVYKYMNLSEYYPYSNENLYQGSRAQRMFLSFCINSSKSIEIKRHLSTSISSLRQRAQIRHFQKPQTLFDLFRFFCHFD